LTNFFHEKAKNAGDIYQEEIIYQWKIE